MARLARFAQIEYQWQAQIPRLLPIPDALFPNPRDFI